VRTSRILFVSGALFSSLAIAQALPVDLNIKSGNEIGVTISSYSYSEPSINVSNKATNYGIEYQGAYAFGNNFFMLGAIDYNYGEQNYSGSGTISGIPTYYYNLKGAIGYDFAFEGFNFSPYVGLGYRFLSQQAGGMTSSTGNWAYDRQSTYNYLPIGLIHRMAVGEKSLVETTLEYDYLLSGNQYSGLAAGNGTYGGVTVSGIPNVNNKQNSGYGLNLTVMYKEDSWGIGPYLKYWNIQQSDNAFASINVGSASATYTVYEPANNTKEFGLKVIYRF
jgi:hypothetical protein